MPHRHADDPRIKLHLTTITITAIVLVAGLLMVTVWLISTPAI